MNAGFELKERGLPPKGNNQLFHVNGSEQDVMARISSGIISGVVSEIFLKMFLGMFPGMVPQSTYSSSAITFDSERLTHPTFIR